VFNIGPFEFLVLAAVALIVFGPDKLPQLTKDAVRMLRTLRDIAQGARTQLTSEMGPEFANFDLQSLNPKTALRNAIMGDDDLDSINPKEMLSRALRGEDEPVKPVSAEMAAPSGGGAGAGSAAAGAAAVNLAKDTPLAAGEIAPYDADTT
jgi:sec-independent protein translocase protein TatB